MAVSSRGTPGRLRGSTQHSGRCCPTRLGRPPSGISGGGEIWRRLGRVPDSDAWVRIDGPTARSPRLARLEAVLLLAGEPLPSRKLAQYADLADGTEARTLVRKLNGLYDTEGCAFRAEEVAGGFRLLTRQKFAPWLRRLATGPVEVRLSGPAMETLAVVAYQQPVLRADVEAIRGVQCGEILRQLMERELVRIAGRSDELGRPFLYGTTKHFLAVFGLRNLEELPRIAPGATDPSQTTHDTPSTLDDDATDLDKEPELNTAMKEDMISENVVGDPSPEEAAGTVADEHLDNDLDYDDLDDDDLDDDDLDDDDLDDDDLDDDDLDDDDFNEDEDDEDDEFEENQWEEVGDEVDDEEGKDGKKDGGDDDDQWDEGDEDEEEWDDEDWEEDGDDFWDKDDKDK